MSLQLKIHFIPRQSLGFFKLHLDQKSAHFKIKVNTYSL